MDLKNHQSKYLKVNLKIMHKIINISKAKESETRQPPQTIEKAKRLAKDDLKILNYVL